MQPRHLQLVRHSRLPLRALAHQAYVQFSVLQTTEGLGRYPLAESLQQS